VATSQDSEAGWEIFKANDFAISLSGINDQLAKRGYSPVSPRTYRHYFKLQRYGYEFYVPINQLDVKTVKDPVWDKAVRGRYLAQPLFSPTVLRMVINDELVEFVGDAIQISDGEVVVRLRGKETVQFFQRLSATDRLAQLIFKDTGELVDVQVERVSLQVELHEATLRLTFAEVTDVRRFVPTQGLPSVVVTVVVGDDSEKYLATEVQRLYWIFQGLESSRIVCQELAAEIDPGRAFSLPLPRVTSLSSQSPLNVSVEVAEAVALVFLGVFAAYGNASKAYWEGRVQKETARRLRWENDLDGIPKRFDTRKLLQAAARVLRSQMEADGAEHLRDLPDDIERAEAIVAKDIMPAAKDLAKSSDGRYEISTDRPVLEVDALGPPGVKAPRVRSPRPSPARGTKASGQASAQRSLPPGATEL
jgi:hypothetical protein